MEIGPIRNQNLIFWPTRHCLVKIDEGQQKIKIVRTNRQPNLSGSCQSFFSLSWHHPNFLHNISSKPHFIHLTFSLE